jgi:hypothetical protein
LRYWQTNHVRHNPKRDKEVFELPLNIKLGLDITKSIVSGQTQAEIINNNYIPEGALAGGPVCWYKGK